MIHEYPITAPVPRPRVPIRRAADPVQGSVAYAAGCHHCAFEYEASVRAAVEDAAQRHRVLHRRGGIAVTRGPMTAVAWPDVQVAVAATA